MKKLLWCFFTIGMMMTFCNAQNVSKKYPMDEVHGRGEVKKALIVMDKTVSVPKEAVEYNAKYQIDDNAMATKKQARDKAVCEFTKNRHCSVIVDPKVRVTKKKGFFMVKINGYPASFVDLNNGGVFKRPGLKKKNPQPTINKGNKDK